MSAPPLHVLESLDRARCGQCWGLTRVPCPGGGRLEDLSEGDFDDGAEEESDEEVVEPTGPPWKCAVCHKARWLPPGRARRTHAELDTSQVLLLSEATLKTHVESKARHV